MSRGHSHEAHHSIGHRLRRLIFLLVCVSGIFLVSIFGAAYYLSPQDKLSPADAIIVISGGQTRTRAERGIELYKQGVAPKLIFSGAALDDGPSNAHEMRLQALRAGVPDSAILSDEEARTTYQNAQNTKRFIDQMDGKSFILVTSPYHQRRANMTFKHIFGSDYRIINQSSYDNRWSKATWWATPFGVFITGSELAKVAYIGVTQQYE